MQGKCKPCSKPVVAQVPIAPPWNDPRLTVATCAFRSKLWTLAMGAVVQVLNPDPTRVMVGLTVGNNPAFSIFFAPIPDVANAGFPINNGSLWFKLFDFGPLVTSGWWVLDTGGGTATIWEVYRLQ